MLNKNYKPCTNFEDLKNYIGDSKIVAFDFETSPLDDYRDTPKASLDAHRSDIIGISFCVAKGTAIYVPLKHRVGTNAEEQDKIWAYLKTLFTDKSIVKIAHNLSFEAMFLYARNIILSEPCYDTLAAMMMTLKTKTEFHTLTDCGLKKIFPAMTKFDDVTKGKHFDELDPQEDATIEYACADSDKAFTLYHNCNRWFDENLPSHRKIVETIESPTAVYCGLMAYNGIPFDLDDCKREKERLMDEIGELKKKIDDFTGGIDIGKNASSSALTNFLFHELKLPVFFTTEKGKPQMDDTAFKELKKYCAENNKPEILNFLNALQTVRKMTKTVTTYLDGYSRYHNPITGCIHPSLMPLGTKTGRFSSQSPNMQNMPRLKNDDSKIRDFIVAPENHKILSVDFSQIELRVGAYYCRDEKMIDTYLKDGDIHAQTAEVIFGKDEEDSDTKHASEHRTIAKNCNFGVFYGLYPNGLFGTLKYKADIQDITVARCKEIINSIKNGYPKLTQWQENVKREIHTRKYSETKTGRRRYLPNITSSNRSEVMGAERQALNTPIQGTAADIIKMSMARIVADIADKPWLKPILQIHDELVFIVPDDHIDEAVTFVKSAMEVKPFDDFDIPLRADPEIGQTLGTLTEYPTKEVM